MAKAPTITDVARLAGVSRATAARVTSGNHDLVKEETRQRVLHAVRLLGYERNMIAGSLRTNQTFMIALLIPDITNPFWPEVARGVQDTIESCGYSTVMLNSDWSDERERNYLRMIRRNRFDGLVINPTGATNADFLNLGIPVVMLGIVERYADFDCVGSDTEGGARMALESLYALGHRRIALIAGRSMHEKNYARYRTYVTFHARHQLLLDETLIVECEFSDEAGAEAMQRLLCLPQPPTAVLAANDILAIGALKAAKAEGIHVPTQLSIYGMDDIYAAARTSPALSTVSKRKYDIGVKAAELLLERMAGHTPSEPRRLKLPCELIERESTAAPEDLLTPT